MVLVSIIIINFIPRQRTLEILAEGGLDPSAIPIDRSGVVDAVGDRVARDALI